MGRYSPFRGAGFRKGVVPANGAPCEGRWVSAGPSWLVAQFPAPLRGTFLAAADFARPCQWPALSVLATAFAIFSASRAISRSIPLMGFVNPVK
ncbi:hypothetical protein GCM10009837_37640 [Streptomyces durmitorensis]